MLGDGATTAALCLRVARQNERMASRGGSWTGAAGAAGEAMQAPSDKAAPRGGVDSGRQNSSQGGAGGAAGQVTGQATRRAAGQVEGQHPGGLAAAYAAAAMADGNGAENKYSTQR